MPDYQDAIRIGAYIYVCRQEDVDKEPLVARELETEKAAQMLKDYTVIVASAFGADPISVAMDITECCLSAQMEVATMQSRTATKQ